MRVWGRSRNQLTGLCRLLNCHSIWNNIQTKDLRLLSEFATNVLRQSWAELGARNPKNVSASLIGDGMLLPLVSSDFPGQSKAAALKLLVGDILSSWVFWEGRESPEPTRTHALVPTHIHRLWKHALAPHHSDVKKNSWVKLQTITSFKDGGSTCLGRKLTMSILFDL